jgi:hypothetical protein
MANQLPGQGQPPNGIHVAQQQPNYLPLQTPSNAMQYLKAQGVPFPSGATQQEVINLARQVWQSTNPLNKQQLNVYKQNLAVQQSQQGLAARASLGGASPANQSAQIPFGTPGIPGGMNFAGRDPRSSAPTEAQLREMTEAAKQLGGTLHHPQSGSHSLSDYQSQLMVLEHQNKKRLQSARQETNSRNDEPGSGPLNGQFQHQGQLQPSQQALQGTSMSPSNSRTGPSPQISNLELQQQQQQQRKPGQKGGSGAASPEPDTVTQIRGPSPAFVGQPGGMTHEQFQQMTQMGGPGYSHSMMLGQNGQPQYMAGRPLPGIQFNQHSPMTIELMKSRVQPQAGQPFPAGWAPPMMNQPMNPVHNILLDSTDF